MYYSSDSTVPSLGTTEENRLRLRKIACQDLGDIVPEASSLWLESLYQDISTASAISEYLAGDNEYCNGRWTRIPENPSAVTDLHDPHRHIITSIIERLGRSQGSDAREAVICQLIEKGEDEGEHSAPPGIIIRATGPSFSSPAGSQLGFSNVASYFGVDLDSQSREVWTHLVPMSKYAKSVFMAQPNRWFVRSMLVTERQAQLFHFDRSGAQHSPLFDIHEKPEIFIRLILGLVTTNERTLGLDTSIRWTTSLDGTKASGSLKTIGPDNAMVSYNLSISKGPITRSSLQGRGTTCWFATNDQGERFIVKDYWVTGNHNFEFELLEEAKGLRGVCQIVSHEGHRAHTLDFRGDTESFAQGIFQNRTSIRIVMKAYGQPVEHFASIAQLLGALRDAIAGHKALVSKNILHRDISPNNILLGDDDAAEGDRGVIIDLDHALRMNGLASEALVDAKTGTRLSQPLLALRSEHFIPAHVPLYDYLDDLEAFFWVFAYLVLTRKPNGDRMPQDAFIESTINGWLNSPYIAYCSKRDFLDSPTIEDELREAIDPGWGVIFDELFLGFHAFALEINNQKAKLVYKGRTRLPDGTLAPNRFDPILGKIDDHYARVLGLFDTALEKIKKLDTRTAQRSMGLAPQPTSLSTSAAGTNTSENSPAATFPTSAEQTLIKLSNDKNVPVNTNTIPPPIAPNSLPPSTSLVQPVVGSKRRLDETDLDDELLKDPKRGCPSHQRQFQGMLGPIYRLCRTVFR